MAVRAQGASGPPGCAAWSIACTCCPFAHTSVAIIASPAPHTPHPPSDPRNESMTTTDRNQRKRNSRTAPPDRNPRQEPPTGHGGERGRWGGDPGSRWRS
eukprot:903420-Rhodomonas_salina.1